MISDSQFNTYISKIVNEGEKLSIETLSLMAKRAKKIGNLAPFDRIYSLQEMSETNYDISQIRVLRENTKKKQQEYFDEILWDIALLAYIDLRMNYEIQNLVYHELKQNREVLSNVYDYLYSASIEFANLIDEPMMTYHKTESLESVYRQFVSDLFYLKNTTTYDNIVKRSITRIYERSIRYMTRDSDSNNYVYKSASSVLSSFLLDKLKGMIDTVNKVVAKQTRTNGVELSAHIMSAPDHEPVQGRQFSNEEFAKMQSGDASTDINKNTYSGFTRPIGAWNCRHYVKPIVIGVKPQYSEEQLKSFATINEVGYTDSNGKHYTLYECTQLLKRYENTIRDYRERYVIAKALGDSSAMTKYKTKAEEYKRAYELFSNQCGIAINSKSIKVPKYQ